MILHSKTSNDGKNNLSNLDATYKEYLNICLIIVAYNLMWCCMLLMTIENILENKELEYPLI